jgi:hypothetical protein
VKAPQKSLRAWTKQKWRTKSGKPSTQGREATGERYLPSSAISALSDAEYQRTTRAKRAAIRKGKQFAKQPKDVAKKSAKYR